MAGLYKTDFCAWANEQARLLREGRLAEAALLNVAEEIESMGRGEKRELSSRLNILLTRLLKWQYQPSRRTPSWQVSIQNARDDLADHLKDNPSLKSQLPEAVAAAYRRARRLASVETSLPQSAFPLDYPWPFEMIADPGVWPGE